MLTHTEVSEEVQHENYKWQHKEKLYIQVYELNSLVKLFAVVSGFQA